MKRLIASLAALAPVAPASAGGFQSTDSNPAVDRCKAELGVYPGENLGDCISLRTTAPKYFSGTGGEGFIAHICEFYQTSDPADFYAAYDSYNDCILDGATNL